MRLLPFFLFTAILSGADLKIDHVTIAGNDLAKMRTVLAAAGIPSVPGGPHANHATEMALSTFPDGSYLELIAAQANPDPQALAKHEWSKQIQQNAGPGAWATRVEDVNLERKRLQAAGIVVDEAEKNGRVRPDGFRLQWETAQVGAEARGTFFPFLIRDFTSREQRTGKPLGTSIRGVSRVVIAVRDIKASVGRFRAAYQWAGPDEFDDPVLGAHIAVFKGTAVVLASPLGGSSWVQTRLQDFGEGPCALVFGVTTKAPFKVASTSRWAGGQISWISVQTMETGAIPWHLGIE